MRKGLTFFSAFAGAVFLAVYLLPSPVWLWLGLGAAVPAGVCWLARRRLAALICAGVAAALLWSAAYHFVFVAPAEEADGRRMEVTAVMSGEGEECWVLFPGKAPVRAVLTGLPAEVEANWGDRVTVTADCSLATYFNGLPSTYLTSRGVFLEALVRGEPAVERRDTVPWWCLGSFWGAKLRESVRAVFPQDVAELMAALTTGDRGGLDSAERSALSRSGVSHLAAVSGLHMLFLVSLLTLAVGRDLRRRAAVCIPAAVVFTLMVGATPSALRACVLQVVLLTAPLLGREVDRPTALSFALALLLLLNPYSAAHIGLQLSFAACLGLMWCTPAVSRLLLRLLLKGEGRGARLVNRVLAFLWETLAASLGASVFTVPISLIYFGTLSLISPVMNVVLVPVVSVLFAGGLLVGLGGLLFPAAAQAGGWVLAWLARLVQGAVALGGSLPLGAVTMKGPYYPLFLAGTYGLGLLAVRWRGEGRRPWLFFLCGGVLLAGAVLLTRLTVRTAGLTAGVLDVGQGQSVVLTSGGRAALVDCGGSSASAAGAAAADYLADRGEDTLDLLILTHFHYDHTNGLYDLFRRVKVEEVVLPVVSGDVETQDWVLELALNSGAKVTWVAENTEVTLGEANLRLYAPLGAGSANEEGLSVLASAGDFDILITGDMSGEVEEKLAAQGLPRCEVLVVGHHGSAYATGDALLDAIRPEQAVISVGPNRYGHPARSTLDRLEDHNVAVYRTDELGTVTVQAAP